MPAAPSDELVPSCPHLVLKRFDVSSVRDFRALVLEAAISIEAARMPAEILLFTPKISRKTISTAWDEVIAVLRPEVASRLYLTISSDTRDRSFPLFLKNELASVRIGRPNYTFEVLRIIANSNRSGADKLTIARITELIGASQTPIRRSLQMLKEAGLINGYSCDVPEMTLELLARVGALPEVLRLRFKQGATPRSTQDLLDRAKRAFARSKRWSTFALSGVPAAKNDYADIDLLGLPRLDLCLQTGRHAMSVDLEMLEDLDAGLEIEPNPTARAPIVIGLTRANIDLVRSPAHGGTPLASHFDVYLSLLDMGLRKQAVDYAKQVF